MRCAALLRHTALQIFVRKENKQMLGLLNALPGAVCQGLIWGVMAIGVYITYKILDIADLTVDGTLSLGGVVMAVLLKGGQPLWIAMLIAVAAGCLAGLATGIFHTKFGIPAILAGILTQLGLYSVFFRVSGGASNIPMMYGNYPLIISLRDVVPSLAVCGIIIAVLIAGLYWFFGTELGNSLRATGCNQNMARANGINTDTGKIIGLVISNAVVALSGAMLTQFQGGVDVNLGKGAIVIGLAAVIIGEVLLGKIFKNLALRLLASVVGGIVYYIVMTIIMRLGLNTNDLKLFTALLVAMFLGVPYWRRKITERKTVKEVTA